MWRREKGFLESRIRSTGAFSPRLSMLYWICLLALTGTMSLMDVMMVLKLNCWKRENPGGRLRLRIELGAQQTKPKVVTTRWGLWLRLSGVRDRLLEKWIFWGLTFYVVRWYCYGLRITSLYSYRRHHYHHHHHHCIFVIIMIIVIIIVIVIVIIIFSVIIHLILGLWRISVIVDAGLSWKSQDFLEIVDQRTWFSCSSWWWCGDVMVILWWYHGDTVVISWWYCGDVMVIS